MAEERKSSPPTPYWATALIGVVMGIGVLTVCGAARAAFQFAKMQVSHSNDETAFVVFLFSTRSLWIAATAGWLAATGWHWMRRKKNPV